MKKYFEILIFAAAAGAFLAIVIVPPCAHPRQPQRCVA